MVSYKAPRLEVQAACAHWTGLSAQAGRYRAILCDLWGVMHNGVRRYEAAEAALIRFRQAGGQVLLISNAPRPSSIVRRQLDALGIAQDSYDAILTSGDLTQAALIDGLYGRSCYHIGPPRDLGLFDGASVDLAGYETADFILCTGFQDDRTQKPEHYRLSLEACLARDLVFVCANPDRLVERDGQLIPCAGQLADFYEKLGGRTIYFGKPYDPIYTQARALIGADAVESETILAIGDGLETDIAGACRQRFHSLFITAGIAQHIRGDEVKDICRRAGYMPHGWMNRLAW